MTYGPSGEPPVPPEPPTPPPSFGGVPTPTAKDAKGFLGALFDFSFSTFITPMIVKFVYILGVLAAALFYVVILVALFADSAASGLFWLILGPVITLIWLAFFRMTLEFYLAITRMSEDVHRRLPPG